jgi:hypothetical protein
MKERGVVGWYYYDSYYVNKYLLQRQCHHFDWTANHAMTFESFYLPTIIRFNHSKQQILSYSFFELIDYDTLFP